MDIDENDILYTNQFIKRPEVENEVPSELNEEFKKYYKREVQKTEEQRLRDSLERVSLRSSNLEEDTDATSILNTNKFSLDAGQEIVPTEIIRKSREVKTYVNIDSRDRNRTAYPKPNDFRIFLGKTFYNVKTIRLASIEFPNTSAVINSTNNRLYWRNQEDIDDNVIDNITKTYPVYNVELRIGSYIATSIQTELSNKLSVVKRRNKTGDFHYFDVNLDIDTDIVTLTSLILTQLNNNPISVTSGLGVVTVTAEDHGYSSGDVVYIIGAKNIGGIPASLLNTFHTISVIDSDTFHFEVNVKAGETGVGGGNTVKSGKKAPFQLLFGENSRTVAQNIGFPLENSSQRIDTSIKKMDNFYQAKIVTREKHNMLNTFDYINRPGLLFRTTPDIDGSRVITKVLDERSFLVSVDSKLSLPAINTGMGVFVHIDTFSTYGVLQVGPYDINTVLVETFTDHNYEPSNIGSTITFYDTISVPNFDQVNTIDGVLSSKLLVVPGALLENGDVDVPTPGAGGSMPHYNPLKTKTGPITDVIPGTLTTIVSPNHGLNVGDRVKIYNLITSPLITLAKSGIHAVHSVLDSDTFTIDFQTNSYDVEGVQNGLAYIGLPTITVTFPYHGFNSIVSITPCVDLVDTDYNVEITTTLPHNLTTGSSVRVMQTDVSPSIDDGGYIVKVIDADTFRIVFPGGIGTSTGTTGIIGMSNDFYMYGATSVGGIEDKELNGIKYTVKEIIDEHTFTFDANSFAVSMETGGGNNIFISSLRHGFNGIQANTKNSLLNKPINLEGENYAFVCCPQLATMMNTGSVKDIFARVTLDQSPGSMVFTYLSNPKEFDTVPLNSLNELDLSIVNYDGTKYEFNDLDWSCCLEITEVIDTTESFNYSSRRGVTNF